MTTTTHDTVITIGARLRQLRRTRGWSQTDLAAKAGMSINHVHYLERGNGEPNMETMRKLAFAFGMTLSGLMEGVV